MLKNSLIKVFEMIKLFTFRWRQVIRRCASVSDTGVTGVCNWGVYENGVYWEECYCSNDACNSSNRVHSLTNFKVFIFLGSAIFSHFVFA